MDKILITGGTGFIGSHLAELCVQQGFNVTVFDRYNPNNDLGWLEQSKCKSDMNIILGDIRDYDSVSRTTEGQDIILHLAALIGIPYSYVSPLAYLKTNIEGTYNILEAARKKNIDQILITSTSETYGTAQYTPIDEKHPLVGQSPYSASKIAADQLAVSYYNSFGLPIKIVRPFNTYGPRQSSRAIIPTVISQILNGQKELKVGNLGPTRDLTFVKDTASGFLSILKCEDLFGQVTNIGMNKEISIGELINKISSSIGVEVYIESDPNRIRPQKSEVDQLLCDNSKIRKNTDWEPEYNLDTGLELTIKWAKNNLNYFKPDKYNI